MEKKEKKRKKKKETNSLLTLLLEYGFSFDLFIALAKLACFTIISVTGLWCNATSRADYKPLMVDAEKEKSKNYGGFSAIDVRVIYIFLLSCLFFYPFYCEFGRAKYFI
jgi:hypothetical protein